MEGGVEMSLGAADPVQLDKSAEPCEHVASPCKLRAEPACTCACEGAWHDMVSFSLPVVRNAAAWEALAGWAGVAVPASAGKQHGREQHGRVGHLGHALGGWRAACSLHAAVFA